MSKFKVGDKVRIISEGFRYGLHKFNLGEIVTITKLECLDDSDTYYRVDSDSDYWFVDDLEIELVE